MMPFDCLQNAVTNGILNANFKTTVEKIQRHLKQYYVQKYCIHVKGTVISKDFDQPDCKPNFLFHLFIKICVVNFVPGPNMHFCIGSHLYAVH